MKLPKKISVRKNVTLRLLSKKDALAFSRLIYENRSHLRQWLPWVDGSKTLDDASSFIVYTQTRFEQKKELVYGLFEKRRLVGIVATHEILWEHKNTSLGYWISQDEQGKGLITDSVRALLSMLFTKAKLHRVSLSAATGNKKSCAIARRLGFKREGLLKDKEWLYDHFVDHAVFAITRPFSGRRTE